MEFVVLYYSGIASISGSKNAKSIGIKSQVFLTGFCDYTVKCFDVYEESQATNFIGTVWIFD